MNEQQTEVRIERYERKYGSHHKSFVNAPVLSDVLSKGYCIIPNYWSSARCLVARNLIDDLLLKEEVLLWADELEADKRIMGANRIARELDLFSDERIYRYISNLYGSIELSGFTMAAKLEALDGNLGSGQGWHRDSCIEHQFKAILYLSDVNEESGPFQYYVKSGNPREIAEFEERSGISFETSRLSEAEEHFEATKIDELCAKEGTLIIANTRGIHRGKPIQKGIRYALTNYYWRKGIPKHIMPFLNGNGF